MDRTGHKTKFAVGLGCTYRPRGFCGLRVLKPVMNESGLGYDYQYEVPKTYRNRTGFSKCYWI